MNQNVLLSRLVENDPLWDYYQSIPIERKRYNTINFILSLIAPFCMFSAYLIALLIFLSTCSLFSLLPIVLFFVGKRAFSFFKLGIGNSKMVWSVGQILPLSKGLLITESLNWNFLSEILQARTTGGDLLKISAFHQVEKNKQKYKIRLILLGLLRLIFGCTIFLMSADVTILFHLYFFLILIMLSSVYRVSEALPLFWVVNQIGLSRRALECEIIGIRDAVSGLERLFRAVGIFVIILAFLLIFLSLFVGSLGDFAVSAIVLIISYGFVFTLGMWFFNNTRYLWIRQTKIFLREVKNFNLILDLYHRKKILNDPDWFRGHEDALKKLCDKHDLSAERFNQLVA